MNDTKKTNFEEPNWGTLAQSIGDGEAILLLGPDALPMYGVGKAENGQLPSALTFSQLVRHKIMDNPNAGYAYFYERDNLFLFKDSNTKKEARKTVRQCASDKTWMPDNELLRQIATIPFPVIVSVNPDTYLRDTFATYNVSCQFDYYSSKDKEHEVKIENPSKNNPLLFNICGNAEDFQSVILDYSDLFALLRNLLNDSKIPTNLRSKLSRTDTYILLGFHFERWYFQLFLHYLNMLDGEFDNSNKNFLMLSDLDGEDTRNFMMQQFNLKWIAPSREDFEKLYAACEKNKILRKIDAPQSALDAQVRQLIARNDIASTFAVFENETTDKDILDAVTLLRARYTAWQEDSKRQTEDSRDLAKEINQIRYTLLTLATQKS